MKSVAENKIFHTPKTNRPHGCYIRAVYSFYLSAASLLSFVKVAEDLFIRAHLGAFS